MNLCIQNYSYCDINNSFCETKIPDITFCSKSIKDYEFEFFDEILNNNKDSLKEFLKYKLNNTLQCSRIYNSDISPDIRIHSTNKNFYTDIYISFPYEICKLLNITSNVVSYFDCASYKNQLKILNLVKEIIKEFGSNYEINIGSDSCSIKIKVHQ